MKLKQRDSVGAQDLVNLVCVNTGNTVAWDLLPKDADEIVRRVNTYDALIKIINQIPDECHCNTLHTYLRCEADAVLSAASETQK